LLDQFLLRVTVKVFDRVFAHYSELTELIFSFITFIFSEKKYSYIEATKKPITNVSPLYWSEGYGTDYLSC
jgi:hypothetical protein